MTSTEVTTTEIALWFAEKYRARMRAVGLQAVCTQFKKQGVTPEVAAHLLFGRAVREPAWHGGIRPGRHGPSVSAGTTGL